jgi:DNA-binding CsgD family transcriptional regulator
MVMNHFLFLYLCIVFSIGIFMLSYIAVVALKTRDRLIIAFLCFFVSFTVFIMTDAIDLYLFTNVPGIDFDVRIALYYIKAFTFFLLMFFITFLAHNSMDVRNQKARNALCGIFAVCGFLTCIFSLRIDKENTRFDSLTFIDKLGMDLSSLLFLCVMIYTIVITIMNYSSVKAGTRKRLLRQILVSTILFVPGVILDTIRPGVSQFVFYPILHCILGIIMIVYIRNVLFNPFRLFGEGQPGDEVLKRYLITNREKEVLLLVAEGKSNKQIGKKLFISLNTVKTHIKNIFIKLNIENRFELITLIKSIMQSKA